jgi:hypothetical protein
MPEPPCPGGSTPRSKRSSLAGMADHMAMLGEPFGHLTDAQCNRVIDQIVAVLRGRLAHDSGQP